MATAAQKAPRAEDTAPAVRPIPRERMVQASFVINEMMNITLPENETVEEGEQEVRRWEQIGTRFGMNQWLQITNDAGSMWRLMRVERIHVSPGSGLRALVLRDVVPPKFIDLANEPVVATGEWYVRYGGTHRRWMVITPAGTVRRDGINSEAEARTVCHRESGNPKPL